MPLRDHFHPPLSSQRRWGSVHGGWPMEIVRQLFDLLPPGYQAEPKVHLGSPTEVDIGTFESDDRDPDAFKDQGDGGTATMTASAPTLTVEANLAEQDQYEVLVYDDEMRQRLVAAIEIISPSNKDRPDTREVFVGKVVGLLQQGVCVSLIDLVSNKEFNLYAELLALLGRADPQLTPTPPHLYAVSLRARKRPRKRLSLLDAWYFPLTVGHPLPTIPLWLSPSLRVELPLEPSYQETCRLLRIA